MMSKIAVLIPDMAFVAFTTMLILWIGGPPLHWLLDLVDRRGLNSIGWRCWSYSRHYG
jgi:hypothetical protein